MAEMFEKGFSKRFVNPYNFIPLMGKCERSVPEVNDSGYTGYFDCEIKLLTPLFIPNTSSCLRLLTDSEKSDDRCQKERWKGYDFFPIMTGQMKRKQSAKNGLPRLEIL